MSSAPAVKPRAVFTDTVRRFSLEIDDASGRTFVSIPVSNAMVDYLEWYEVEPAVFERYVANPRLAHAFVEQAKLRELDHLLLFPPGRDRGVPDDVLTGRIRALLLEAPPSDGGRGAVAELKLSNAKLGAVGAALSSVSPCSVAPIRGRPGLFKAEPEVEGRVISVVIEVTRSDDVTRLEVFFPTDPRARTPAPAAPPLASRGAATADGPRRIVSEGIAVDTSDPELVRIDHSVMKASGVDMGGVLFFERTNLDWVITHVENAIGSPYVPEVELVRGDDHLSVGISGHESFHQVDLRNRRWLHAREGGLYVLDTISPTRARELVTLLRAAK